MLEESSDKIKGNNELLKRYEDEIALYQSAMKD